MKELAGLISDKPMPWLFMCIVVVVGGPAFLNQMAARYLPGGVQQQVAEDVQWIERRSNQFTKAIANQEEMLDILKDVQKDVDRIVFQIVVLRHKVASLEAWREFERKVKLEESPGYYP